MASNHKFKRGSSSQFVMLEHWVMDTPAWLDLKPSPRALFLELKRLYKGGNNGDLFLSHRDAANRLNCGRDTVSKYYTALIEHGFLIQTRGHCLGPAGLGQAATYALTDCPYNKQPATLDFKRWKKQKPRWKIQPLLAGKSNTPCWKIQPLNVQMSENTATLGPKHASTVLENPATYTSNHIPKVFRAKPLRVVTQETPERLSA